jgi:hypothetical protein
MDTGKISLWNSLLSLLGLGARLLGNRSDRPFGGGGGGTTVCRCAKCGYTQAHTRGVPCANLRCPRCGTSLRGQQC